jgi:hypothetical protein
MNEEGSFYIGTTVFDLRTGEQFAIPLEADNEPGTVTNQILNNVLVKESLALTDGATMFFGNDTAIYFGPSTTFNTTSGPITANQSPLPEVYASTEKAGLVQLADESVIRGSRGSTNSQGVAAKAVVTAADLSRELNVRFDNAVVAGTGIEVQSVVQNPEDGDPLDPTDDVTKFLVSAKVASSTQQGIIEIATAEEVREFASATLAVTPATLVQALGDSVKNVVNLRLSLSPTSPVPDSDQSGSSIFVHPWNGNEIALYEPAGTYPRWYVLKFDADTIPEFPLAGLGANTVYDVYLWNSGTISQPVLAMDFSAWSTALTPPGRGKKDGIQHKLGDVRKRFVGVLRTTASGQSQISLGGVYGAGSGDFPKMYLANLYNPYDARAVFFFGNYWDQPTNDWSVPPGYAAAPRVSFVQASNTLVTAFLDIYGNNYSEAGSIAYVAPGIDALTPPSDAFYGETEGDNHTAGSQWARSLSSGLHDIYYLYRQLGNGNNLINEHPSHGMIVIAKI